MRRTRGLAVVLIVVGLIGPGNVMSTAHASSSRHGAAKIRQHLVTHGRRRMVTHSGQTREFDQNTVDTGGFLPVTSSTGKPLFLGLFMDQYGSGSGSETDLEVQVADDAGQDSLWDITVRDRGLIYDTLSGQGQIRVSSEDIAGLGSVHLDVSPAGPATTTTCASGGRRVVRPIRVRGTIVYDTKSDVWGTVGDPVNLMDFHKHATAESDYGKVGLKCEGFVVGPRRCRGEFSAYKGNSHGGSVDLETYRRGGSLKAFMFFDQFANLPGSLDLNGFEDISVGQNVPTPTLTRHSGSASIALDAGTDGLITGGGTWSSTGKPHVRSDVCKHGTSTSWAANFANATDPLTVTLSTGEIYTFADSKRFSGLDVDSDAGKVAGK